MLSIAKVNHKETAAHTSQLDYEQVIRLNTVMYDMVKICGNGNFPTLEVRFCDLVEMVRDRLRIQAEPDNDFTPFPMRKKQAAAPSPPANLLQIRSIRLNGGATSHVLTTATHPINDLDLIFNIGLSGDQDFDRVKCAVLRTLVDLLPEYVSRERLSPWVIKEGYVSKMVKVDKDGERWSLISLGTVPGQRIVELKFVDRMKRPYEFSVDSFQIVLDSLLLFYRCSGHFAPNFFPTVLCESMYGDYQGAMSHLERKLIVTKNPEQIRGGGLLKYCSLLLRNYKLHTDCDVENHNFERYMCSRFFKDFPDILQLHYKLENYLKYHFCAPEEHHLKLQFLGLLMSVIGDSTVSQKRRAIEIIQQLWQQIVDAKPIYHG